MEYSEKTQTINTDLIFEAFERLPGTRINSFIHFYEYTVKPTFKNMIKFYVNFISLLTHPLLYFLSLSHL